MLITCRREMLEVKSLSERRETLRASLLPRTILPSDGIQSNIPDDVFADRLAEAADLTKKIHEIESSHEPIFKILDKLEDPRQKRILTMYYLELYEFKQGEKQYTAYKLHTWRTVSRVMGYSERHVKRLHNQALNMLR